MKRIMTLIASISGTICSATMVLLGWVLGIVGVTSISMPLEYADPTTGEIVQFTDAALMGEFFMSIGALLCIFGLVALILNAMCIKQWKRPQLNRGLVVSTIVFTIATACVCFAGLVTIMFGVEILIGAVLLIIDLKKEKKRVEKRNALNDTKIVEENTATVQQVQVEETPVQDVAETIEIVEEEKSAKTVDSLEDRLAKIADMKEKGLIDEAEYTALRQRCVKEYLEK